MVRLKNISVSKPSARPELDFVHVLYQYGGPATGSINFASKKES